MPACSSAVVGEELVTTPRSWAATSSAALLPSTASTGTPAASASRYTVGSPSNHRDGTTSPA